MLVFTFGAPVTQQPEHTDVVRIVGDHGAAFAACAQVLPGIETEAGHIAQRTRAAALVLGSVRLGSIFDDGQLPPAAISTIGSMSAGWPYKCTGKMALVRGVSASSTRATSMLHVRESMSTKTGRAPVYSIAATEAANVNGTVITSSPGCTPAASNARWRALVPEFTPMAHRVPQYRAKSFSKASTSGPRMKCAFSRTRAMAASISALIPRYWAFRSASGIMCHSQAKTEQVS